jgi:adenylate cyclase
MEQRRGYFYLQPRMAVSDSDAQKVQQAQEEKSLDKKLAFLMHRGELAGYDARFKFRGDQKPNPDIVIVAIDENSLAALHQWPWPRGIHASLIRKLRAAPPKALLFDVFFIEPFTSNPSGDRDLVQATKQNSSVVHSIFYEPSEGPIRRLGLPFPALLEAAGNLGYANAVIDDDGVLRRAILQRSVEDQSFNFMSVMGASLYLNKPVEELLRAVPLDPRGRLLVHFVGREFTYPYLSYADVLSGKIPASQLAGKIVLVGSSATGTFDHYPTPLSKFMPGVEFHANVIDNLLTMNAMKTAGLRVTYLAIGLLGLFCGLLLARYSAWAGALWALGGGVMFLGVTQFLFTSRNLVVDVAGPMLTLYGGYLAIVI